jgi:hypothetical protein
MPVIAKGFITKQGTFRFRAHKNRTRILSGGQEKLNNSFTAFRSFPGSTIATAGLDITAGPAGPLNDLIVLRPAETGPELTVKKYWKHQLQRPVFRWPRD